MAAIAPNILRDLRRENPKARARDFAELHGVAEADLVAAHVGFGATAIAAHPDQVIPWVGRMGDVMALTRNQSCVHERRGQYSAYHTGSFAAMVLDPEIDLRMFLGHWVHAFAVENAGEDGTVKRSIQVFDAAGDAVHKVFLQPASDTAQFAAMVADLALPAQSDALDLRPRAPADTPRADVSAAPAMRASWDAMTDTHQFHGLLKQHNMNRLGAYRLAGAPYVRPLSLDAVTRCLHAAADHKIPVMIFVGNAGCIQIHGGPIARVVPMGPWINVLDDRFNLHLRADHIAEVYRVWKPTDTGDVYSIEAFDAQGALILQIFAYRKDVSTDPWIAMTDALPSPSHSLANTLEEAFA